MLWLTADPRARLALIIPAWPAPTVSAVIGVSTQSTWSCRCRALVPLRTLSDGESSPGKNVCSVCCPRSVLVLSHLSVRGVVAVWHPKTLFLQSLNQVDRSGKGAKSSWFVVKIWTGCHLKPPLALWNDFECPLCASVA